MRVRFDDFTFDSDRRELIRGTEPLRLPAKAFQLLEILIENRPRAVSQKDLYDRLWPETYVEPSNLHNLIYQIREALDDRDRTTVKTVYGFGFVFGAVASDEVPASIQWQLVIGRDAGIAVRIESSSISRRHARIVVSASGVTLEDVGSKNGTTVTGVASAASNWQAEMRFCSA
jgi:DNA-binding winged helix-turn-helix (wHTH) protein